MWERAVEAYLKRTPGSKRLYEMARSLQPGGVNHNIRHFSPYPFFVRRASGATLWDVDGNAYCDYWMGHMALILGHSPEPVAKALAEQARSGTHFGAPSELSLGLADLVCDLVPCAEMLRFCNTGTEATMYAVRLARAYTGRRLVLKAEGGWHGGNTVLNKAVHHPFTPPESAGVLEEEQRSTRTIPFNDADGAAAVIRENRGDLACVIVEPVLGAGSIPAEEDFLRALREETEMAGALLIFDEVITGFRLALGGAQERYGVKPDLCALGKVLGGGMPVGAVCGRREVLGLADPSNPALGARSCWIGGGTFSGNPMTMAAGLATLRFLKSKRDEVYGELEALGSKARSGIDEALREKSVEAVSTGLGSLLQTHVFRGEGFEVRSLRDVARTDRAAQSAFHLALIALHGIFFLPGHAGAISYAHTLEDIERLISAAEALASNQR